MKNNYTIGQIQDLYDFMNFNVKNGFMDEDIAEDIMESGNWAEASRLRGLGDLFADSYENMMDDYDSNKPEEAGCEAIDFIQ